MPSGAFVSISIQRNLLGLSGCQGWGRAVAAEAEEAPSLSTPAVEAPERVRTGRFKTFSALRYRKYRYLWFAQIGSSLAQQAEMITTTYLVFDLTDSAIAVGLVHLARAAGSIGITPYAGVMADRIDRRLLLIAANSVNAVFFLLVALLFAAGNLALWHLVIGAVLAGAALNLQNTGMQSVIPSVVPREHLMNAMGLQSVIMGSGRVFGPSAAGFSLALIGVSGTYVLNACLVLIPVVLYILVGPFQVAQSSQAREPFWTSFRAGLSFALASPTVRVVMLVGITVVTFGMPFLQLLPVYVKDVLDSGPATLGLLASVPGVLTILGGMVTASMGDYKYKGRLLFAAVLSPPAAAIIMSQTDAVVTTLFATCLFGLLSSFYMPSTQSAVMKATPDHIRGRVASLIMMTQNLGSIGVLMYGLSADVIGIQGALLLFGSIAGGLQILYFVTIKSFRQMS